MITHEPTTRGATIGVFDSGVGGLTVLAEIHRALPVHDTIYLGDTARVPYGTRSPATVQRYAINAARFLAEREDLGVLVVACNTVSAVALDALRQVVTVPVIGVIEPTARAAVRNASKTARVGILGTRATIASGAYEREIALLRPSVRTFTRACPLFVPLAEEGWTDPSDPIVEGVARRYLLPLLDSNVDTIVLGCTHYPLLKEAIASVVPRNVALIDAGASIAAELERIVGPQASTQSVGRHQYCVTDLPDGFRAVAERFLGAPIAELTLVDL